MLGGTPAIAILISLTSFPPTSQPSGPATLTWWCFQKGGALESLGPRTGRRMQVHPVLHDASSMGLDPYSGKTWPDDATRRVPGATLQHWYSAWMCAPRLYVMRPRLAFVWRLPEFLAGRSSSPSRRNRVTIHFSIPPRFDSRNDGLRPVVGWDVLAAQRSILSSGQKLQYCVCIFFFGGLLCRVQTWPLKCCALDPEEGPCGPGCVSSIPSCRSSGEGKMDQCNACADH